MIHLISSTAELVQIRVFLQSVIALQYRRVAKKNPLLQNCIFRLGLIPCLVKKESERGTIRQDQRQKSLA